MGADNQKQGFALAVFDERYLGGGCTGFAFGYISQDLWEKTRRIVELIKQRNELNEEIVELNEEIVAAGTEVVKSFPQESCAAGSSDKRYLAYIQREAEKAK